jgi:hypothetical protein
LAAAGFLGLTLLVLAETGCFRLSRNQPKAEVKSLQQKTDKLGSLTPTALQSAVMRYADEYSMGVAEAVDKFAANHPTREAGSIAARIKVGQATAAVLIASGANPVVNALDLVVLASVSRMVAEDYLVGELFGQDAMPILEIMREHETNAWTLVMPILRPEQEVELRELIAEWRRQHPKQRYIGAVRFREFAESIGQTPQPTKTKPTSVLSLVFLDPMAGLDPTLRAVEEARYLAERTLYYAQRMPVLLSWQAEVLSLQLVDQPAARQILTNANDLSAALQIFAKTAEQLPQLVKHEREAGIQQVLAGVATERSNVFANLATEEKKMRTLLGEARSTLKAADAMAVSANAAIQSLSAFMLLVVPPKTNVSTGPAKTNARPFNVLDYGTAAGQVGAMARDINSLLAAVNQNTTQFAQLGQQAAANVEGAVQRGFRLGLLLVVILLAGAVIAGLTYRVLAEKLVARQRQAPPG